MNNFSKKLILVFIHLLLTILCTFCLSSLSRSNKIESFLYMLMFSLLLIVVGNNEVRSSFRVYYKFSGFLSHKYRYNKDTSYLTSKGVKLDASWALFYYLFSLIPFRSVLYSAYALLILFRQISSYMDVPLGLLTLIPQLSGIEPVAIFAVSVDRLISALQKELADSESSYSKMWRSNKKTDFDWENTLNFGNSCVSFIPSMDVKSLNLPGEIIIISIDSNSEAYKAGIREFDILVSLEDETPITSSNVFSQVLNPPSNITLMVASGETNNEEQKKIEINLSHKA